MRSGILKGIVLSLIACATMFGSRIGELSNQ